MPKGMFYLEVFICVRSMLRIRYSVLFVLWWNYKAQSFHKLKVAFNNAFRMMHNLPTYCSASEMFTVNRVADCKAVIRNLVHRFMTRLTISKHLLVHSILSSDLVWSSRIRQDYCMSTITVDDNSVYKPCAVPHYYRLSMDPNTV